MTIFSLFITCPKGFEETLKKELENLDIKIEKLSVGGVEVETNLEGLYLCALHLRTANRILLYLYTAKIKDAKDITQAAQQFKWDRLFDANCSLDISFRGQDEQIRNTMFGAQCLKDGISDYFRQYCGQRPVITKNDPDIKLQANLKRGYLNVYLDVFGQSLHQRGYRQKQGSAPLKENVASGLLMLVGWPEIAAKNGALIDPMCGSGTFLIEAWQMATQYLPGFKFGEGLTLAWHEHQPQLWQSLYKAAFEAHQQKALTFDAPIIGFDHDPRMVDIARSNLRAAGLEKRIQVSVKDIAQFSKPTHLKEGLIISNPPFGERLSTENELLGLYQMLGKQLTLQCQQWRLGVLTASLKLSKAIGLKSFRQYKVKNGALDCLFALFDINEANKFNKEAARAISKEGEALLNRLKKNTVKLQPWLKREKVSCYRWYDADLAEFNVAIDVYQSVEGEAYLHVQEYKAPKTISQDKVALRLQTVIDVLTLGLGFSKEAIFVKQRMQQKGKQQYERESNQGERFIVKDGSVCCFVNLKDFLDTGLFLDHRRLRASFDKLENKSFLNLFCYTGVASLHAAKQGGITTNVDMSRTYLNWAKDNFRLNHLTIDKHSFIQEDVLAWLDTDEHSYDVIFCDPPSFSNSKRMEGVLDIERDHESIIEKCMKKLVPGGVLYFSCNLKKFALNDDIHQKFSVIDLTQQTTSKDFEGSRSNHHSFKIKS